KIFVSEGLKLLVHVAGKVRPVSLKSENGKREQNKHDLPNSNTSVCQSLRELFLYFTRKVVFEKKFRAIEMVEEGDQQKADQNTHADDIDNAQSRGRALKDLPAEQSLGFIFFPIDLEEER